MVPDKFQHEIQKGADEGSTVRLHLSPRFPEPTIHLLKIEKFFTAVYLFFIIFLGSKIAIYYPQASIMAAQATEAFSPQKRTYRTSKRENSLLFSIFMGHSPPPLIRIQQLIIADPCGSGSTTLTSTSSRVLIYALRAVASKAKNWQFQIKYRFPVAGSLPDFYRKIDGYRT